MEGQKKPIYKKWWFWTIIVFVLLAVIGSMSSQESNSPTSDQNKNLNPPTSSKTYIVEVTGTNGLQFSGSLGGGGESRSIDGEVPSTYTIEGWPAVAVIQKKQESGKLVVTIKRGTDLLSTQETTAAYGVVTVSA